MQPDGASAEPRPPARVPAAVRIFIGPFGLRSGWRFLLFFLCCAAVASLISFAFHKPLSQLKGDAAALGECILAIAALAATWIMSRIEHKPFSSFGLGAANRGRNLAVGVAAGLLSLSLLIGLLMVTGAFHPGPLSLTGSAAALWGLFWLLAFIGVAFAEELLMRGYALFALTQGIGFWPAAVILALLFGAGHQANSNEQIVGIANAVLIGLVLAYSVRWSGSLWWAIGYHIAWDWAETFFYGVGDSGQLAAHHFLSGSAAGSDWLSGGAVGPEGSILCTLIAVMLVGTLWLTVPKGRAEGLERLKTPHIARLGLTPSTSPIDLSPPIL
jgi:uncharacterized protein